MNFKSQFVSAVTFVSLFLAVSVCAEPVLTPATLTEVAANPVRVAMVMRDLSPEQRLVAARELIVHVKQTNLSEAEKARILANVAAACLAAVEPAQRAAMAWALVAAGGVGHVRTIMAAIALAAGADAAGQEVVRAAVNAAADLSPDLRSVAEQAAREPDVVLGPDVATDVVRTTQEVLGIVLAPLSREIMDDEAEKQPILPPPAPPRAHPYEAQ